MFFLGVKTLAFRDLPRVLEGHAVPFTVQVPMAHSLGLAEGLEGDC